MEKKLIKTNKVNNKLKTVEKGEINNDSNSDTSYITQSIGLRGDFSITKNWKVSYMTNYDFMNKEFSFTSINIVRDLHCWQMSFNWIPVGFMRSYNLNISVKSSILQDLKLQRRKTWYA